MEKDGSDFKDFLRLKVLLMDWLLHGELRAKITL
jgi:hypothetical protein